ncbi:MAG: hypothetical protein ACI9R3_001784 [Verrucomicrobiales bacterium]|jgi:hypothetical protein
MHCSLLAFSRRRSRILRRVLISGLALLTAMPLLSIAVPPRIQSFIVDDTQLPVGGRPWLSWETVGADRVTLSPGIGDVTDFTNADGSGNGVPPVPVSRIRLVSLNADWNYLDDGDDLSAEDWQADDFDDSGWLTGPGPLGYGDATATALEFGPDPTDKFITYYFRKQFEASAEAIDNIGVLYLELQRDDGAAVYLNGAEIVRDNLPDAALTADTESVFPTASDAETQVFRYIVDKSQLRPGTNILSAEVHQSAGNSSDLIFDAGLYGVSSTIPVSMVEFNSNWQFLDDGSNLSGTNWQASGFDDSQWRHGNGEFGYDSTVEATLLDFGDDLDNKHITYYFRRKFLVGNVQVLRDLTANLLYDDGAIIYINGVEVARLNLPDAQVAVAADTLALSASVEGIYEELVMDAALDLLVVGENTLAVEIHQANPASSDISFDLDLISSDNFGTSATLIERRVLWKFDDTGKDRGPSDQDPATAWFSPVFDDSGWNAGPAELGYGDSNGETSFPTTVSFGPAPANKWITCYFRHEFTVAADDLSMLENLNLSLLRDDAAVVYLNGEEIVRDNLADGAIDNRTLALAASSTTTNWTLDKNLINAGTNTLAVEIHQQDPASTDMLFDLRMTGIRTSDSITYTLTAINDDGSATAEVTLNYLPVINGSPLPADPIFLETTQPAGTDWEFASMWSDRQIPRPGNDYVVYGNFAATVRSPQDVVDPDFGGNLSLIGPRSRFILSHANGSTAHVPLLTIKEGAVWHSRENAYLQLGTSGISGIRGSRITVDGAASFNHASVDGRRVLAVGSDLAGSGTITVNAPDTGEGSTATLFLGDGSAFTGEWIIRDTVSAAGKNALGSGNIVIEETGALDFDFDYYNATGTLTLIGRTSQLVIDHTISVESLLVRGLNLPVGVYEGVAIEALGQNFVDRGGKLVIGGSDPDTDDDGLTDDWEKLYFDSLAEIGSDDSDGDGATNAQEQIAGTDPSDSGSILRLSVTEAVAEDGITPILRLSWPGLISRSYFVQISDDLMNWRVVSLIPGTDATTTYVDDVNYPPFTADPALYYRVVVSGS